MAGKPGWHNTFHDTYYAPIHYGDITNGMGHRVGTLPEHTNITKREMNDIFRPEDKMQAQAPTCPLCFEDHTKENPCDELEIKKEILKARIIGVLTELEEQDMLFSEAVDEVKNLVDWF